MDVSGYINSNHVEKFTVTDDNGNPFDMTAAGIIKIEAVVQGVLKNSDDDPDTIFFSGSTLNINFGDFSVYELKTEDVCISGYKFGDTEPTPMFAPGLKQSLLLEIRECQ